jgi:hypothetical protein
MFAAIIDMRRRGFKSPETMRTKRALSTHCGALPEIRLKGESVVFYLAIDLGTDTPRLVVRCDPDGNVWASVDERADTVDPTI